MERVGRGDCTVYEEKPKLKPKPTVKNCYHSRCFNPNEPHCAQNKRGEYKEFSTSCELMYEQCIHSEEKWVDLFSGKCENYLKSLDLVTA